MKTLARLLLILALAIATTTHAADIVWTNTAGGNWNVAANFGSNQMSGSNETGTT